MFDHVRRWCDRGVLPWSVISSRPWYIANSKQQNSYVYVINFKFTIKFLLCFIFLEANIEVTQDREKPCSTSSILGLTQ